MFEFTDDCKIGIEQIDNEHECLFEILNEAFELLEQDVHEDKYGKIMYLIEKLGIYANTHFKHEEDYMEKHNDPELEMQRKQHQAFRIKIDEFSNSNIIENQNEILSDILQYMTRWLYHHILSSDIMIGKMQPVKVWKEKKNPCTFTEEYYTGIETVDSDHAKLFEIIGNANDLIRNEFIPDKFDNIVELFEELTEYTKFHFSNEEKYMEEISYEGLEAQKKAHAGFVSRLEEFKMGEFDENQQEVLLEIMDFLFNWLVQHILKVDKLIPVK